MYISFNMFQGQPDDDPAECKHVAVKTLYIEKLCSLVICVFHSSYLKTCKRMHHFKIFKIKGK